MGTRIPTREMRSEARMQAKQAQQERFRQRLEKLRREKAEQPERDEAVKPAESLALGEEGFRKSLRKLEKKLAAQNERTAEEKRRSRQLALELKAARQAGYEARQQLADRERQCGELQRAAAVIESSRQAYAEQAASPLREQLARAEEQVEEQRLIQLFLQGTITELSHRQRQAEKRHQIELQRMESKTAASQKLLQQALLHAMSIQPQLSAAKPGWEDEVLAGLDLSSAGQIEAAMRLQIRLAQAVQQAWMERSAAGTSLKADNSLADEVPGAVADSVEAAAASEEPAALFGYILQQEDRFSFYELNGTSYSIDWESADSGMHGFLKADLPARAVLLDSGQVRIVKQYRHHYAPPRPYGQAPASSGKLRRSGDEAPRSDAGSMPSIHLPAGSKVLVLGSRKRNDYMAALREHGADADWFDGYEESLTVLKQKWRSANAVLICTRHVPHAVHDIVDRRDPRVQWLDQDNARLVVVHASHILSRREAGVHFRQNDISTNDISA